MTNTVDITKINNGEWRMRTISGVEPWETKDPERKSVANNNRIMEVLWWVVLISRSIEVMLSLSLTLKD